MAPTLHLTLSSDLDECVRIAEEHLRHGEKIEMHLKFRGREMAHTEIGFNLVHQVLFRLATTGRIEREPRLIGRNIHATLLPIR